MKNARTAAHAALLQVDVNAGYSNIVIDKAIKEANLDQRDASLAAAILWCVGTQNYIGLYYQSVFQNSCKTDDT